MPLPFDELVGRLVASPRRVVALPDARRAAVAAVFRPGPDGAELLFIQRASQPHDPWSGQIAFPGGREEPGDADLQRTATRETAEELGLDLTAPGVTALGPLDALQARSRVRIHPLIITPFAFALRHDVAFPAVPNREVSSAFWFPVRGLLEPARQVEFDAHREEAPFVFPAVELGLGRTLWGLTHRMVFDIHARLGLVDDVEGATAPRARAAR